MGVKRPKSLVQYKTITKKKFADLIVFFVLFQNFTKIKKLLDTHFCNLSINKPFLGSCEVPYKIWIRLVQPF